MHQKEYKHPHNQTSVIELQRFTETVTSSMSESTASRQTAKNAKAVMVVQLQAPIILIGQRMGTPSERHLRLSVSNLY